MTVWDAPPGRGPKVFTSVVQDGGPNHRSNSSGLGPATTGLVGLLAVGVAAYDAICY